MLDGFSERVETAIVWDNLHEWSDMTFMTTTVEPICTPEEYDGDNIFKVSAKLSEVYHARRKARGGK